MKSADGTIAGTFSDQRGSVGRIGYGGGSNEFVVELCIQTVGADIAEMIATGNYRGGAPVVQVQRQTPNQAAPPAVDAHPRETADRLREVEALRVQGLLTEKEYQEKRRRIIEDF